jgi:hypothetical protein
MNVDPAGRVIRIPDYPKIRYCSPVLRLCDSRAIANATSSPERRRESRVLLAEERGREAKSKMPAPSGSIAHALRVVGGLSLFSGIILLSFETDPSPSIAVFYLVSGIVGGLSFFGFAKIVDLLCEILIALRSVGVPAAQAADGINVVSAGPGRPADDDVDEGKVKVCPRCSTPVPASHTSCGSCGYGWW